MENLKISVAIILFIIMFFFFGKQNIERLMQKGITISESEMETDIVKAPGSL